MDTQRLEELLGRYVEGILVDGNPPDPAALCAGEPELLGPLREHIREYERLNKVLAPPKSLEAGRMLLHYRILQRLGQGGMGEVYVAEDTRLGRRVALKLLRPETAFDEGRRRRFLREARIVAALNHPSIVTIYAVEETDDFPFLAMELVEGKTLAELIPRDGLPGERILEIAEDLAAALEAAHGRGIVHRDLKPANVMVRDEGGLKVLDFGIAALRDPDEGSGVRTDTFHDRILGTLPYMSPEQAQGLGFDARTDLFSFGVVLYEMATGRRPFVGRNAAELLSSILRDAPAPIGRLRGGLPERLERIVARCLRKDPAARFSSAAELRAELLALRQEADTLSTHPVDELKTEDDLETATLAGARRGRRLYLADTSEDLASYRAAAEEVARELGFETTAADPGATVEERQRRIAEADALLALVGWSRGGVPTAEAGGDALRSFTQWEVGAAFRRAKPVLVLMASESWPEKHWEEDSEARALVRDFRGELAGLAETFDDEPAFRAQLRPLLEHYRDGSGSSSASRPVDETVSLRTWPAPRLPGHPYPVLLPYSHPDLLAGRERELAEVRELLRQGVPLLGIYAPSGSGKSSLLAGGVVPSLRAEGRPVAFDAHPEEPGLASRLLADLVTHEDGCGEVGEDEAGRRAFVDHLLAVRRLSGVPPVLVLDPLDVLLRPPGTAGRRRARAVAGTLLAATLQRRPGLDGPLAHWILSYRQELHGEACGWLEDVLREARAEGFEAVDSLPHDLSGAERFQAYRLAPLGTPSTPSRDRLAEAAGIFQRAIEKPLAFYPWRFHGDGAARLAKAFGQARLARPEAPLAPELQVVLAYLIEQAEEPREEEPAVLGVDDDPGVLIDRALDEHLRRALDAAFPLARAGKATRGRTRALLALRELADDRGRGKGLAADALAQAIGGDAEQVLERLATSTTRLVVLEERQDGWCYVLAHDRLAEVIVRLVDGEGRGRLGIDAELLALRRFVVLQSELYAAGEATQATAVPRSHVRGIEENADTLLCDEDRRRWWAACRRRRRTERRARAIWATAAAVVLTLLVTVAWTWAGRRAERRALFEQVAAGEPGAALAALHRLASELRAEPEELLARLRRRKSPTDVLERGMGGVAARHRAEAVLRAVEIALPLVEEAPEDPVRIANLVWALDYGPGREPAHAARARVLRDRVLEPLRRLYPPPPSPDSEDPDWVSIPAGTFWMGSQSEDIPAELEEDLTQRVLGQESPRHQVTVSAFRMLRHEVTRREYRRLVPGHNWKYGDAEMPPAFLSWWEAYTYAAWLGGRLATEAEWEYAARAGCRFLYCKRDGSQARLVEMGWTLRSNVAMFQPVMQLEPNPWGLYDMYGNFSEWVADWYDEYSAEAQKDPWGPPTGLRRGERGGAFWHGVRHARAAYRDSRPPGTSIGGTRAIRVVLPVDSPARPPERSLSTGGPPTRHGPCRWRRPSRSNLRVGQGSPGPSGSDSFATCPPQGTRKSRRLVCCRGRTASNFQVLFDIESPRC